MKLKATWKPPRQGQIELRDKSSNSKEEQDTEEEHLKLKERQEGERQRKKSPPSSFLSSLLTFYPEAILSDWWREAETLGWKAPKAEGGNLPLLLEHCGPERLGENTLFFSRSILLLLGPGQGQSCGQRVKVGQPKPQISGQSSKKRRTGYWKYQGECRERRAQGSTTLFINSWAYSQAVHVGI